jgi:hypothetical protein
MRNSTNRRQSSEKSATIASTIELGEISTNSTKKSNFGEDQFVFLVTSSL